MILADVAHARAGDKGTRINVSVILFDPADYAWLADVLTAARVRAHLGDLADGSVTRYALPNIGAFNFVFARPRGQSVTRSLRLDAHGKSTSSLLLAMPLPDVPARPVPSARS